MISLQSYFSSKRVALTVASAKLFLVVNRIKQGNSTNIR